MNDINLMNKLKQDIATTKDPIRKALLIEIYKFKLANYRKNNYVQNIIKKQDLSLNKLKEEYELKCRKKAYEELVEENEQDDNTQIVEKRHREIENKWEQKGEHKDIDPMYTKYVENDAVNNKMKERLTAEIEFRSFGENSKKLMAPYDNNQMNDVTDTFANFNKIPNNSKH